MKKLTLTLVRHAKSSWKDPTLHDRERPLNKRGHRDAADMADRLASKKHRPDLLISSPALRARTTAEYFAHALGMNSCDIHLDERLYFCGAKGMRKVLRKLPLDVRSVMLFGHNPDISLLASDLLNTPLAPLPTCTVIKLKFDCAQWGEIDNHQARLKWLESPKQDQIRLLGSH
ncbi:MAG: histidine phosphatase family protein [Oleiphilaceae bacterium]|nr:histidine phosphatase family protein [Oleiphilaceae bacterium]